MKLKLIKFIILIISTLMISCENGFQVKSANKKKDKIPISTKVKSEIKTKEIKTNQTPETHQNKNEELDISDQCIFKRNDILLPQLREEIGDTINIKNTTDWISNLKMTDNDEEIKNIINRRGKFFQINETNNFVTIGFIENEGEYIGIYAYSINKENCKIIGKELLSEASAWENGFKETYSKIETDFTLKRETKTAAKDKGDGTRWIIDTIITMIIFDEKGNINSINIEDSKE